ncbi:MAG: hypothetical protein P4M07_03740 [Xanthobacteraceae bacterium]|nr:hypothetical protein [Xanthobacteraceae bacterium]
MSGLAEVMSSGWSSSAPRTTSRERELPTCTVCSDSMIAAEASAFLSDDSVIYLWTCETCGYGFVTRHDLLRFPCN